MQIPDESGIGRLVAQFVNWSDCLNGGNIYNPSAKRDQNIAQLIMIITMVWNMAYQK